MRPSRTLVSAMLETRTPMTAAPAVTEDSVVRTEGLGKRYGSFAALKDCDLSIGRGEVFGLLGPNGAGKTTLIRLLMGYHAPSAGRATIAGLDCYRQSVAVHRTTGYLPGEAKLFPLMRGRQVLRFFAEMHPRGDYAASLAVAERLDLDLSRRVAFCSTGMKQKIALASVLACRTDVVILDEPTSSLDPTVRTTVGRLIAEMKAAGRTVLFSSHVLGEVEAVCDRVGILRGGELVCLQAMDAVRRQHRVGGDLAGAAPPIPDSFGDDVHVTDAGGRRRLSLTTAADLPEVLRWLAAAPLTEVSIQPVGLQAVYDRYHAGRHADA